MAIWNDLSSIEGNDPAFNFELTYNSQPFDLTESDVKIYLKATQDTPDSAATIFDSGSGLNVTNPKLGFVTWAPSHAFLGTPGTQWYRMDVINASSQVTTFFVGNFNVTAA